MFMIIINLILFPFKLFWNLIVSTSIIASFIVWYGFIFGSVVAVILIVIFMPELFLLPLRLSSLYVPMWKKNEGNI